MFGKGVKLFTIFGFAVKVDISWLIILVLIVWSLAGGVFPQWFEGLSGGAYFLMGLAGAAGLFGSIIWHELSHSLVARRFGLPITGITLFVFGGVSEMAEEPPNAQAEFFMAIAGPASSVVLGVLVFGVYAAAQYLGWPLTVTGVLIWLALINIILAIFNMLPGFPLDGGRILRSILWHWKGNLRWATRVASRVGAGFGLLLIGLGFVNLLFGLAIGGLWYILIGMFLRGAAKQGYQQVLVREALEGEPVRRFTNTNPVTVPPTLDLQHLVDDYVYRYHYKMYPVVEEGRLQGCISTREIRDIPRTEWETTQVGSIIRQCSTDNTIGGDQDAVKALAKMSKNQLSRLLVIDDGNLAGVVTLKDLLKFLSLKMELEESDAEEIRRNVA